MCQNLRLRVYTPESYRFITSNFVLGPVWRYMIRTIYNDISIAYHISILKRKLLGENSNCSNLEQNKEVAVVR